MFNISIEQISIWIWSNALYNSRGNQINIAQITILQLLFINQIKCWFLMRGENRSTRGKTSYGRVENQQNQSTYGTECGNRTRATLVEGKCSHHYTNPATNILFVPISQRKHAINQEAIVIASQLGLLCCQVLTQLPPKRRQKVVFDISDSSSKDRKVRECWTFFSFLWDRVIEFTQNTILLSRESKMFTLARSLHLNIKLVRM